MKMIIIIIIIINIFITLDYKTAKFNIIFPQLLTLWCVCVQLSTSHCTFKFSLCEFVLVVTGEESYFCLLMISCISRANCCTGFIPSTKFMNSSYNFTKTKH